MRRLRAHALGLVLAALVLAGCSGGNGAETAQDQQPSPSAQGRFNDADVQFATDMIPHHAQAVVMAEVAVRRSSDPELRALAGEIRAAQEPEIRTMAGWLRSWGELVPPTRWRGWNMDDHDAMGHGGGMMGPDDLRNLRRGPSGQFGRMWLSMMIAHHQGAVQMARVEQREGANAEARALARRIERTQQDEIEQMRRMLGG